MTIRIPLRLILFILYTAAVLGGAFGISYAVFEWRDDDGGSDSGLTLESLDARIDNVEGRVDNVTNRVSGLSTASGSNDSTACHNTLASLDTIVLEGITIGLQGASLPLSLEEKLDEANADFRRFC